MNKAIYSRGPMFRRKYREQGGDTDDVKSSVLKVEVNVVGEWNSL